ncbi:MAG TPA: ABC-F family ATP-binding cassette domain-containing protein [Candidatus Levybacteria bacterium]|nr:ABC-F family ATP-binding cassette domain-containing protein [Candidatus Levybacteria bacterium]
MIQVKKLSYSYGLGPVFDTVSFTIGNNRKVGLVGPNGAGKSTMLKLLNGMEEAQSGTIEIVGKIGYVPQEIKHDPILDTATSVREFVDPLHTKQDFELLEMIRELEMDDVTLSESPKHLSGGQKTKLALLRALLEEPDILMLDEPTNFLDTAGKKWVMNFLSQYPKTLVIISHDLPLLDAQINAVLALNPNTKKIEEYTGNYTQYLRLKKEHDELERRKIINEQKHIKQMEQGLKKMQRLTSKKGVRQRTMLRKRIERLKENLPELPPEIKKIVIRLPDPHPVGEIPIKATNIVKMYDYEMVLADVSLTLVRGERVALIGPNGAGKSTFIKILMGRLETDAGEVIRDQNLKIGYYSQEFETFDFDKSIIENVQSVSALSESAIRPILTKFNFPGQRIYQTVSTLSGGEKTRLSIAMLMLQNYNLLILDEPTTYLDVMSQRIILDALKSYTGAMIFVSHTPEFVEELQPNRVLLLPENKIQYWIPELIEKVSEM